MEIDGELYPWLTVAVLAWGLLDCFFGYRLFKLTLTLIGALAGSIFGQAAGSELGLGWPGEIGGMIVGALLGAGLAYLLFLAGVFLAGFLFGLTLGILLLANWHQMVAQFGGLALGVIGGILAVKLQRVGLLLATALLGAFRVMLAGSYFTNRVDWYFYLQHPAHIPVLVDNNPWMLPATLLLAAVGAAAQFEIGDSAANNKP
ncbi:MAG: DUF4203 domain-containing protein [Opitutaceae bacterium]|nr:DUF4203 domain-containing protein [Opitutaceae bacterium]